MASVALRKNAVLLAAAVLLFLCLAGSTSSAAAADRMLQWETMKEDGKMMDGEMMEGDNMMMDGGMMMGSGGMMEDMGGKGGSGKMKMKMKKEKEMMPMCPMGDAMYPPMIPMPDYKQSTGTFKDTKGADVTFTLPLKPNGAYQNNATALPLANISQKLYTLKPRTLFAPHYHPMGSEHWTVIEGKMTAFLLLNGHLYVFKDLTPGMSVLFTQDMVHGFFNQMKSGRSVALAAFNNAKPGSFLYEDLTCAPKLMKGMPTEMEIKALIKKTVPADKPDSPTPYIKLEDMKM